MKFSLFASVLFMGVMVQSCGKMPDSGNDLSQKDPQTPEQLLYIENELVRLEREVGKFTLDFMSTDSWTASCDASWVELVGASGNGSQELSYVTVFYDSNYSRCERDASVIIVSGELADTLKLIQKAPSDATISDFFQRVNRENYAYQYICAHRANTYDGIYIKMDCPENSVRAVERCIEMGMDMVEIDVRMTKDGELVCCHDEGISEVTNGTGLVAEMTLDEIRAFDAKVRKKGLVVKGVKMATLGEILDVCKDRIWVTLDLVKVVSAEVAQKVIDELVQRGMEGQVTCYIGTNDAAANMYYSLCNSLSINFYVGSVSSVQANIPDIKTTPVLQISSGTWHAVTPTLPNDIREAGYCAFSNMLDYDAKVIGGNTNSLEWFTQAGIDFLQTDYGDHKSFRTFLKNNNLR